jgi:uroporphyrinogen decarboxylase
MATHDNRMKAMLYEGPEEIPVTAYFLPVTWMKHREALDEIVARHPILFGPQGETARDYDAVGGTYIAGNHVDAWGCVWSNIQHGAESIVTGHAIPRREDILTFRPPAPGAGTPHGFMWLRLGDLRGFEELMVDFAEEAPELQVLIDMVRDYNVGEVKRMIAQEPEIVGFGDDLGTQHALPISPTQWRKYLKPAFQAIYRVVLDTGRYIYMHTDGHLLPIVRDLIDVGVKVLNPQVRANGLEGLARECKGKVCLDLDLDRQLFPFCTPAEIDRHVRECVEALGAKEGGLWLKAEMGPDIPLANVDAICTALERYRGYFS